MNLHVNWNEVKKWFIQLRSILKKDLKSTRRVKKYLFPAIIPPIALMIVFTIFTQTGNPETYSVMLVNEDNSPLSVDMENYIGNISSEFGPWFSIIPVNDSVTGHEMLESFQYLGLITIPAGFGVNISSGGVGSLLLQVQNINEDYVKNYNQRLDEAIYQFNQDKHLGSAHVDSFSIQPNTEFVIDQPVSWIRGLVIGIVALYCILSGICFGALNISKEYEENTIIEVIHSPVNRSAFLLSKQLIGVVLGGVITLIFGTIMYAIFGIKIRGNFGFIIIAFFLANWSHGCIGFLIGLKFKKVMPVLLISIIMAMLLWFYTGGFAPTKMLGDTVYNISRIFPGTYWNEILFAETFLPNISYSTSRLLVLVIMAAGLTIVTWTIIEKRGFSY
ncbi:MAG: ABC transporter permease [Promethearchaeota archaeon]